MMNLGSANLRVRIWAKLALISLSFILPIIVLTYYTVETIGKDIRFSAWELKGDIYQRPLEHFLENISLLRVGEKSDAGSALERADKSLEEIESVQRLYGV